MKKKIVSFITILCMVLTLIPATVATSYAATIPPSVSKTTVQARITELEAGLSGKFFTTDGYRANSSGDNRCNVVNVLNQNSTVRNLIYKNKGKTGYRPVYNSYLPGHYAHDYGTVSTLGWSCFGFANFAEWYIFSNKCSDSVTTKTIAKGIAYNYSNVSSKAKPGDIVRLTGNGFSGHSGIVKSVGLKYMTILDANGDAGTYYGASRITTRNVYYASGMKVSISRATNSVDGWPSVTASNVASTGKVKISWYKKANASKYYVYRSTSQKGTYKLIKKTTATTYTDTAATPGKLYYYKVKAVSKAGKFMAWSDVVNRTCDLARPTIVSAKKVTATSKIKIIWKDVKNANRYEVYRGIGDGNYTKIAAFDTKMNTGKTHYCINSKNMTPNVKYYYKIKAINTNNIGADSALSLAVSCMAGSASTGKTNVGTTSVDVKGTANAIVASAEATAGKSKSSLGLTGEWCARFVYYCAKKSGNTNKIGNSVYVGTMAEQTVNDKGGTIIFVNKSAYNACKNRFSSARCKYDPNYIPQKGDLYIQKGKDLGDQYFAHIGLVRKNSSKSSTVYTIEGNTSCSDGKHTNYGYVEYKTRNKNGFAAPHGFSAFVKPAYSNTSKLTVKYNKNYSDATGSMSGNTAIFKGKKVTFTANSNTFKRPGYNFQSWVVMKNGKYYLVKNGSGWKWSTAKTNVKLYPDEYKFTFYDSTSSSTSVKPGDTITLYARWTPNKYNIMFDANGGYSAPATQYVEYNSYFYFPESQPYRKGYIFKGWSTNKTATKPAFVVGQKTKFKDINDLKMYAVWEKIEDEDSAIDDELIIDSGVKGELITEEEYIDNPDYDCIPVYRYATRNKELAESGYSTLEGYQKYDTKTTTTTSGYYFGTPIATKTSYTSTSKVVKTAVNKGYYYYGYTVSNPNNTSDWTYYIAKSRASVVSHMKNNFSNSAVWGESRLRYFWYISTTDLGSMTGKLNKSIPYCSDSTVNKGTTTKSGTHYMDLKLYKYSTCYKVKTTSTTNYFYKYSDWSDWSDWTSEYKEENDFVKRDSTVMYLVN